MLFNSINFFIFLGVVYTVYRFLPFRAQNWLLLTAGYVFYGWWDVRFLFLIAFSTAVDFLIGILLADGKVERKTAVTVAVFLTSAAAVFLCPNWAAFGTDAFWQLQFLGSTAFAGTVGLIAAAALAIPLVRALPEARRRLIMIRLSVVVNLGFLGIFKYFNFFIESAEAAVRAAGFDPEPLRLNVILPVGISFYTFQSLSYTIDVYRRVIQPTRRFWDFALFVAYFPPMVAGPIERARHLLPQLTKPRRIRTAQVTHGLVLILLGLMKKVAIADGLAPSVASVFGTSGSVTQFDVAVATVLFAFQILCDFSGYSDIARGVSKLFGIELMLNFNLPYFSQNPSDFWRRWHISLSSWLRDYLYITLGGNRKGRARTYVNLFVTMLLGGLWHGAAWNYVLWGAYQGALLSIYRAFSDRQGLLPTSGEAIAGTADRHGGARHRGAAVATILRMSGFFVLVCYGWMLFRATSFQQIAYFNKVLLGLGDANVSVLLKPTTAALAGLALLAAVQILEYRSGRQEVFLRWPAPLQGLLYALMIFITAMGSSNAPVQFIYFQF
jgi:alginate O-acetyltransferase complex protein AlgI